MTDLDIVCPDEMQKEVKKELVILRRKHKINDIKINGLRLDCHFMDFFSLFKNFYP